MGRVSVERVVRMALGGAVGGFIAFLLLDPSLREEESNHQLARMAGMDVGGALMAALTHAMKLGIVLGIAIGVALIFMEELPTGNASRLIQRMGLGILVGGVCGLIGALLAQVLFSFLLLL